MATVKLRQDLTKTFGDIVAADDKLISECVDMCQIFNMSAEDLLYKWEALSYSSTRSLSTFTMDTAHTLKTQIQRDIAMEKGRKQQAQARTGRLSGVMRGKAAGAMRVMDGASAEIATRGKVPTRVSAKDISSVSVPRVVFKGPKNDEASRKKRTYHYMYEKISERSEALDDRIDQFAELVREHYKIDDLGDPSSATDDNIYIVGRIILDSDSAPGSKLNESSVALESSRMLGFGARVPLRFDSAVKIRGGAKGAGGFRFFPGAMAAFKGKNGGAGLFLVTEILAMPPLPESPAHGRMNTTDSSLSMVVATGTFTPDSNLDFKPWHSLLSTLRSQKPAVVLLIGPFIDSTHPFLRSGAVDSTPAQLFHSTFTENLKDFLATSPSSIVLIVPSMKDLISEHLVFPQGELRTEFSGDSRIHLLPNPSRFAINDISFAVSSVDVVFHLRKEEFLKRGEEVDSIDDETGADSMGNLCRHILQQRSFYPIFPVSQDLAHEINLDVSHSEALNLDSDGESNFAPDVLIVPSRLKQFSKMVHNTTAINPSFLTKGTYSRISIGAGPGVLKERMKVEVVKLEDESQ